MNGRGKEGREGGREGSREGGNEGGKADDKDGKDGGRERIKKRRMMEGRKGKLWCEIPAPSYG